MRSTTKNLVDTFIILAVARKSERRQQCGNWIDFRCHLRLVSVCVCAHRRKVGKCLCHSGRFSRATWVIRIYFVLYRLNQKRASSPVCVTKAQFRSLSLSLSSSMVWLKFSCVIILATLSDEEKRASFDTRHLSIRFFSGYMMPAKGLEALLLHFELGFVFVFFIIFCSVSILFPFELWAVYDTHNLSKPMFCLQYVQLEHKKTTLWAKQSVFVVTWTRTYPFIYKYTIFSVS